MSDVMKDESSSWVPSLPEIKIKSKTGSISNSTNSIDDDDNDDDDRPKITSFNATSNKYWRFDEAAPSVHRAVTHYLPSIPKEYRLAPAGTDIAIDATTTMMTKNAMTSHDGQIKHYNWTRYVQNSSNVFPQKTHLFEMNPSIIQFPVELQRHLSAMLSNYSEVYYLSSYRVTHVNNCFTGRKEDDTDIYIQMSGGGSWKVHDRRHHDDYLGLALLDSNLEIVVDTVVSLHKGVLGSDYQDYRLFVLRDRLYLTTNKLIVELFLTVGEEETPSLSNGNDKQQDPPVRLPLAFPKEFQPTRNQTSSSLHVWLSHQVTCPVHGTYRATIAKNRAKTKDYSSSKNLLYFVDATAHGNTVVSHFPRGNPHDVRRVELETRCGRQKVTPAPPRFNATLEWEEIPPSFRTIDEELYPVANRTNNLYMSDRGSACCVWIPDIRNSSSSSPQNDNNHAKLLLAVVHPKTVFPGKNLPQGVVPNSYFSRFIAIEPTPPYRIVARTGIFCLGYSEERESGHPLWSERNDRMTMGGNTFDCPRISFVTGMVDKVVVEDKEREQGEEMGDGDMLLRLHHSKIILSYGVSDCLSRFVEMSKLDIVQRLFPGEIML